MDASVVSRKWWRLVVLPGWCLLAIAPVSAQTPPAGKPAPSADYVVGAQDILTITNYDQADLSGKFTVESDGTFTYPLIGRVTAGSRTLRQVEAQLKQQLIDEGYFNRPQITVSIEQYRSQKIFVVGEVRTPGAQPLSGDMTLVEALAAAGSTLPTASGELVIVHSTSGHAAGPVLPEQEDADNLVRIDLKALQNGSVSQNVALRDGDTVFVIRAESVYVFGEVKNPGAYTLQQKNTTVLQILSLAGGLTDHGSTGRIRIARVVNGKKQEIKVKLSDMVEPGDTIIVQESFF